MKVELKCELTKREQIMICTNSIERVFNTSIYILSTNEVSGALMRSDHLSELLGISLSDMEDLKPMVTRLWDSLRNAIYLENSK